jgi:hypothetical protein
MNNKRKLAIAASGIAVFTSFLLLTSQANASTSTPIPTPIVSSTITPTASTRIGTTEASSTEVGGDNVQSGDQSTLDVAGAVDSESTN